MARCERASRSRTPPRDQLHGQCQEGLESRTLSFGLDSEGSPSSSPPAQLTVTALFEAVRQGQGPGSGPSGVAGWPWPAGLLLAQLLLRPSPLGPDWVHSLSCRERGQRLRVLELGAGTAVPSVCLACQGHLCIASDLPEVLPLTRANLAANQGAVAAAQGQLVAMPLPFGKADVSVASILAGFGPAVVEETLAKTSAADCLPSEPVAKLLESCSDTNKNNCTEKLDLVLCADCSYDPILFDPLLQTLRSLRFEKALVVVAQRPDLGEETFENFCADEGVLLQLRHTAVPQAANGVGCSLSGPCRVNVYELRPQGLGNTAHEEDSEMVRTVPEVLGCRPVREECVSNL